MFQQIKLIHCLADFFFFFFINYIWGSFSTIFLLVLCTSLVMFSYIFFSSFPVERTFNIWTRIKISLMIGINCWNPERLYRTTVFSFICNNLFLINKWQLMVALGRSLIIENLHPFIQPVISIILWPNKHCFNMVCG